MKLLNLIVAMACLTIVFATTAQARSVNCQPRTSGYTKQLPAFSLSGQLIGKTSDFKLTLHHLNGAETTYNLKDVAWTQNSPGGTNFYFSIPGILSQPYPPNDNLKSIPLGPNPKGGVDTISSHGIEINGQSGRIRPAAVFPGVGGRFQSADVNRLYDALCSFPN